MVALEEDFAVVPHWYMYPPKSSYSDLESLGLPYEDFNLAAIESCNIYVHIPFCNMKCNFCSLFTAAGYTAEASSYAKQLANEIEVFRERSGIAFPIVHNIYFGGGTPSLLDESCLATVMQALAGVGNLAHTHRTAEFSPDVVSPESTSVWRRLAFNRASLGVQTFDDRRLASMHRRHTGSDAQRAIGVLQRTGFASVNIDLIFGHSGQSSHEWANDLRAVEASGSTSCTFHPLAIVPKTTFERKQLRSSAVAGVIASMHAQAIDFFESLGWTRTSAISYAKDGQANPIELAEARGIPTIGFGAGSRSYFEHIHTSTLPATSRPPFRQVLTDYYAAVAARKRPVSSLVRLTAEENARRSLILQMHHGYIDSLSVERALGTTDRATLARRFADLVVAGLLIPDRGGYLLTSRGAVEASTIGMLLASQEVVDRIRHVSEHFQ